jgi:(R,R)-butanediol dehydrogenase/meso-butanediol dehydrogenase/diacetyl reductase
VQGVGGVGAFLIHALVARGVRVVAADLSQERLRIAEDLGAAVTILAGTSTAEAELAAQMAATIPVFFEVTGSVPGLALALRLVPMGTDVIAVGIQKVPVEIDMGGLTLRELSLIGTNAMVRDTDFPEAAVLVAQRRGRWGDIAPEPIAMADLIDKALRPMSEGRPPAIKTLVRP